MTHPSENARCQHPAWTETFRVTDPITGTEVAHACLVCGHVRAIGPQDGFVTA